MVNFTVDVPANVTVASGESVRDVYRIVIPMMLSACILAVFFNVLILVSAYWVRRTISPTLYFSLSLALADAYGSLVLGVGLVVNSLLPTVYEVDMGPYSICLALILEAFRMAGLMASVLHLLALAVNHYIGILRPLHYASTVTKRFTGVTIIVMWVIPITFFFIYFSSIPEEGFQMKLCRPYDFIYHSSYHMTVSLLFFLPLIFMTIMYIHMFLVVRQHQKGLRNFPSSRQLHKNVKAVITTLLILGTYLIGWMPAVLVFAFVCKDCLVPYSTIPQDILLGVSIVSNTMIVIKYLLNPVIYAARMPEIKDALKVMLKCGVCRSSRRSSSTLLSRTETFTSSLRLISFRKDCSRCKLNSNGTATTYVDKAGVTKLCNTNNHYPL